VSRIKSKTLALVNPRDAFALGIRVGRDTRAAEGLVGVDPVAGDTGPGEHHTLIAPLQRPLVPRPIPRRSGSRDRPVAPTRIPPGVAQRLVVNLLETVCVLVETALDQAVTCRERSKLASRLTG